MYRNKRIRPLAFTTLILSFVLSGCLSRTTTASLTTVATDTHAEEIAATDTTTEEPAATNATTEGPGVIHVDSCGADPFDDQPDSDAIQACIDQAQSGYTVLFTSGVNSPDYKGYIIDKTIFLVRTSAKSDLTFNSTDPDNHALLLASPDLLGFVVRLFARSSIGDPGNIDNITVSHLDLDGNSAQRKCYGADEDKNGIDDNWGSWLPECDAQGDSWCTAGTLAMDGRVDTRDPTQDYAANPSKWSTGLAVISVTIMNTECGTALYLGGANSVVRDTTIHTAGEHVHADGCTPTDDDEGVGAWSDGITMTGPGHVIRDNRITDPSDIGIVTFGGVDTVIANNTITASSGNHGMFDGIAIHPFEFGEVSGTKVVGNTVVNEASSTCGGVHVGINIGPHMVKYGGCVDNVSSPVFGNTGTCVVDPPPPGGTLCQTGAACQLWAYVAAGKTFTLQDNHVSGAQVNYLIEGLDLVGTLIESGNTSDPPRMTDWESAKDGCTWRGITDRWGTIDRVANHPSLDGWTNQRIHCTR